MSRSEPTDKSYESHEDHASQEEIEPYSLHNWARARHALETKTNLVPNTRVNYQTYWKIAPEAHGIPDHLPKPTSCRMYPTPIPSDTQARPFRLH